MAECKACGEWFGTATPQDLCPTCERALNRLGGYVAPVRHGRWEKAVESKLDTHTGEYWEEEYYNCLKCDYASDRKSPYCPNCGAKMDADE